MKLFVVNVFYNEEIKDGNNETKYFRKDELTGENLEIKNEELIIREVGTVVLSAESSDKVLETVRTKVSDRIVEVEIISEVEIEPELQESKFIKTNNTKSVNDEETTPISKIIFQSNI